MNSVLPMNIQTTKGITGKTPASPIGKMSSGKVLNGENAPQDFSNILSLFTGKKGSVPAVDAKKNQEATVVKGLLDGDTSSADLTPLQAADLKSKGLLTSKKEAQMAFAKNETATLLTTKRSPEEKMAVEKVAIQKNAIEKNELEKPIQGIEDLISTTTDKKIITKSSSLPSSNLPSSKLELIENKNETLVQSHLPAVDKKTDEMNLEQILSKGDDKPIKIVDAKNPQVYSKVELENAIKNEITKPDMPIQKGEVAFVDNGEILNFNRPIKNSKSFASKEYSNASSPFENNIIQLKKESILEKESLKPEQDAIKSFDYLSRDSSNIVQHFSREPQAINIDLTGASQSGKVLDLSNASSSTEIVNKIVNYLEQSNIQNRENIEVSVKHESLGQFNVNVQRAKNGEEVSIQILTNTDAGHDFFVKNEILLNKALSDAGIKVMDLRLGTLSTENMMGFKQNSEQSFSGNFSGNDQNGQRYYNQKQESGQGDSRRRQELWEQFKERSFA